MNRAIKNLHALAPLLALACFCDGFAADWPTFRGNQQRTGYYADPVGIPSSKPLWVDSLKCPFVSSPSVYKNALYIGGRDSCVYALDADNGRVLWKTKTNGWVDASPLIHNGMVIAGSRDGTIYMLNSLTGAIISSLDAGLQLSSPAITQNGEILSGLGPPYNGFSAYGFSKQKSERVKPSWFLAFNQITHSSPAVFGSRAVIGTSDGRLFGINTAKRDTGWHIQTQGGVYMSTPAIDDSTVYFAPGNSDRNIYAVDVRNGKSFWKSSGKSVSSLAKTAAGGEMISPWQFRELLRFSPQDRSIAIEQLRKQNSIVPEFLKTGSVLAKKTASAAGPVFFSYEEIKTSSVAVGTENVYVVQKELGYPAPKFTLLALDKFTGKESWRFSDIRTCVQLGYSSSPVASRGTVFFGWGEGRLYAASAKTGEKIWSDSLMGDIISSPAIANAKLYVATMDGYVYSYLLGETAPGTDFQGSTYCYPNPARGSVSHIQLYLAKAGVVDMTLYNAAEKPVFRFSRQMTADEKYSYDWNITRVANGVYFALVKVHYADGTSDKKALKVAVLK